MTVKLIDGPTVRLIGYQVSDAGELEKCMADLGVAWASDSEVGGEALSEVGGRYCYLSFAAPRPGGNAAYLRHIKESGHGSVLEHAVYTFVVTGVSRTLTHELVRHRAGWSFSQLSQRYVDESATEVVVPPELAREVAAAAAYLTGRNGGPAWDQNFVEGQTHYFFDETEGRPTTPDREAIYAGMVWIRSAVRAGDDYRALIDYQYARDEPAGAKRAARDPAYMEGSEGLFAVERTDRRKAARGAARSVLPNATETKIVVTANARALRHAVEQRCGAGADAEIRRLFNRVHEVLAAHSPNLFGDYRARPLLDGTFILSTPYPKV